MTTRKRIADQIVEKALELLKQTPEGIRYSGLVKKIREEFPKIAPKSIPATIWDLDSRLPDEVYKPSRGLFRHTIFRGKEIKEDLGLSSRGKKINEEDFYQPFADWLSAPPEECKKAIPVGGKKFKDKWKTPDVIGIWEPSRSAIYKPLPEIISAEIKADTKETNTAFGQACSYKLFSHKSYIVVPRSSSDDDISILDALCLIFGIGLVLFDNMNRDDPKFEIRVRPIKHEPDAFYVNKYMKLIEKELLE